MKRSLQEAYGPAIEPARVRRPKRRPSVVPLVIFSQQRAAASRAPCTLPPVETAWSLQCAPADAAPAPARRGVRILDIG